MNNFIKGVFPPEEYNLISVDIHTTSLPSIAPDLVFTFGTRATTTVSEKFEVDLSFPVLPKLDKETGTLNDRQEAYTKLLTIRAISQVEKPKPIEISAQEFKSFSPEHLEQLKEIVQERGFFEAKLDSGKTLRIYSSLPQENTADVVLTLAEIFLIKFMTDKMGLQSVTINPISTTGKNRR